MIFFHLSLLAFVAFCSSDPGIDWTFPSDRKSYQTECVSSDRQEGVFACKVADIEPLVGRVLCCVKETQDRGVQLRPETWRRSKNFCLINDRMMSKWPDAVYTIVGGKKADVGHFPHMAAIGYANKYGEIEFQCGGSLISNTFVITAAHCCDQTENQPLVVRLGRVSTSVIKWTLLRHFRFRPL